MHFCIGLHLLTSLQEVHLPCESPHEDMQKEQCCAQVRVSRHRNILRITEAAVLAAITIVIMVVLSWTLGTCVEVPGAFHCTPELCCIVMCADVCCAPVCLSKLNLFSAEWLENGYGITFHCKDGELLGLHVLQG